MFNYILKNKEKYESLTTFDYIIASSISKFFASVIAYPHEVLRALFQVQHYEDSEKYKVKIILLKTYYIINNRIFGMLL